MPDRHLPQPGETAPGPLETPRLVGDRVVLRPWRHEDAPRIVQACTDPRTRQFLPLLPDPYGTREAIAYIDQMHQAAALGQTLGWCVADALTGAALGSLALSGMTDQEGAQVGYWTHPDARGRGVTTRALRAALRYAVTPAEHGGPGLSRAWLRAAGSNPASQAVARAAGMREVGRDRGAERLRDGTVDDFVRFDVLAHELRRGPVA